MLISWTWSQRKMEGLAEKKALECLLGKNERRSQELGRVWV